MMLSTAMSWWLLAAPSQAALGPPGTGTSLTLTLTPPSIVANGSSKTLATATVTDLLNNPVAGDAVSFGSNDPGDAISTPVIDHGDGTYTVTITSTTPGSSTITARDSSSSIVSGTPTATLTKTAPPPPPPPPPPTNITPPTISGSPQQGKTLAAVGDTWTNGPTSFFYQWERCLGNACAVTQAGSTATYVLTAADVGFRIRVIETATNLGGTSAPVTSKPTTVVIPLAPVNTSPPTISGSSAPGQTLTATTGGWANNPTSFSYQWDDCDSSGNGCFPSPTTANQATYAVTVLDLTHTIRVQVTATNAGGSTPAPPSPQTGVVVLNSSTTSLSAVPSAAVTNAGVKLTATITSSSSGASPAGTITFFSGSHAIAACTNDLVAGSGPTVIATCQTSFAASTSPEALGAVFTAANGSSVAGSQSAPVSVSVSRDSTSTALDVSNVTVKTGSSTTVTATVSPGQAGPFRPSGSVEFLDGGKPIAFCLRQPLGGSNASSATCIVKYKKKGKHRITAVYGGDANFTGSPLSPALAVSVRKLRTGAITSTMQWTFFYTPAYTKVLTLVVNGPPFGGTVLVECHGQGCPFAKRATPVATFKTCIGKGKPRCSVRKPRTVNLMQGFRKHRLRVGAQITVELIRPNFIGKNYQFKMRSGSAPRIQIRCLAPGKTRPGVGC